MTGATACFFALRIEYVDRIRMKIEMVCVSELMPDNKNSEVCLLTIHLVLKRNFLSLSDKQFTSYSLEVSKTKQHKRKIFFPNKTIVFVLFILHFSNSFVMFAIIAPFVDVMRGRIRDFFLRF